MIIKDIGFLAAFWGGFSSFFSPWQLCLMQITPFFLAFAIGFYLLDDSKLQTPNSRLTTLLMACAGYIPGFSIVFALMGTSGWGASSYILYNIDDFRIAAAIYLIIIALSMVIYNIYKNRIPHSAFLISCLPAGILLGASFALAYSPCIPPVMSDIMNFAGKPANAHKGFHLLVVYGIGLTTAFAISGVIISIATGRFIQGKSGRNIVIYASSAILLIMAFLLITDLMISYKSFLVGLVLD